jgi:hypothetical protein
MADSVGDGPGDVLRRTKSRNWAVGRMRALGRWSDDEIRDAWERLRRQHRPTISDELAPRPVELRCRRPLKFLEPAHHPVWGERGEQLASLLNGTPVSTAELFARAGAPGPVGLGWNENHVKQTLAAAEGALLFWHRRTGCWARFAEPEQKPDAPQWEPPGRLRERALRREAAALEHEQDQGVAAGVHRTRTVEESGNCIPSLAASTSTVRVRATPQRQHLSRRPKHATARFHPWKTRGMKMNASANTTEKPASAKRVNGSSTASAGNAPHASESPASAADTGTGKPEPTAKEQARRTKIASSLTGKKRAPHKKQAASPSFEDELERALTPGLERVVRKVLGRTLGRLVAEAVGGEVAK